MDTDNTLADWRRIDWIADDWFAKYHAAGLTDEFKSWWVGTYGDPWDYPTDDPHEYWVRCGFAWIGWRAALGYTSATTPPVAEP